MRRLLPAALLVLASGCGESSGPPRAGPRRPPSGASVPEAGVFRGEVVALGCYLRQGARGEAHRACAEACLKRGMPAGLLTDTGELYLLLPGETGETPDFSAVAARDCEVQGAQVRRAGMRGILVRSLGMAPPPAPEGPPGPPATR